ncbi:MAG TPA: hypothetical protein VD997_16455 [Phycisphaerales bacterium]|nr:hypothetical protein [Phycisphaerales bacterium]
MDEQALEPQAFTDHFSARNLDRRRSGRGSQALILKGAEVLPHADRALLRAVYADGRSAAEIARLNPSVKARAVSYRVRLLTLRVLSPEFAFVSAHRRKWGRTRAKVATACFLHGLSIREAARLARVSFHTARQHHAAVLELMRSQPQPTTLLHTPEPAPLEVIPESRPAMGGAA